ncbi:MAG: AAA family ATPase [Candidatus Micrarchaeia archaeon]
MRIGITGVPGTGKTTIAQRIADIYKMRMVNVKELVEERKLWTHVDTDDMAKVVNLLALKRELQELPENCIVESHLICEIQLPLDKLIVLRTPLPILEKRLTKRGYDTGKIKSNLYSELLDYCTEKSMLKYKKSGTKIYEVLSIGNLEECIKDIDKIVKGNGEHLRAPWVDILKEGTEYQGPAY